MVCCRIGPDSILPLLLHVYRIVSLFYHSDQPDLCCTRLIRGIFTDLPLPIDMLLVARSNIAELAHTEVVGP